MLELVVAESAGFCFGVRRAVEQTEALAAQGREGRVVTLGPLIHNPREVQRLGQLGVMVVDEGAVQATDTVVLRSHGVDAAALARLQTRAARIHNGTCPHVRTCQTLAGRMVANGYAIVVAGDRGHAETESVISYARQQATALGRELPLVIAATSAELEQAQPLLGRRRVALIAQTTLSQEQFAELVAWCVPRFREVRALNTICPATASRLAEARTLAAAADLVVVVGGRNSANTARLLAACRAIQPRTYLIEAAGEIDARWLDGICRVAITSGASTPGSAVDEVVSCLRELGRHHGLHQAVQTG